MYRCVLGSKHPRLPTITDFKVQTEKILGTSFTTQDFRRELAGEILSRTSLLDTDTELSHLTQAGLVAIELEGFHTKAYTPKSCRF